MNQTMPLALGVFLGNWLLVPLVSRLWNKGPEICSFTRGFWVGIIAAILILLVNSFFNKGVQ